MKNTKMPIALKTVFAKYVRKACPDDAKEIMEKAESIYKAFAEETPDIGGNENWMAFNLNLAMAFFSVYEASDHRIGGEAVQAIAEDMYGKLGFLKKLLDANNPAVLKLLYKVYVPYAKTVKEKKSTGEWNNTWGVEINPEGHWEGASLHLTSCPIADFAKKHGYLELMPYLCKTDHITASLVHAKLIRHHTIARGADSCDYWYVGDRSAAARKYADLEDI